MCSWVSINDLLPDAFEGVLIYMPNQRPLPQVHEGYYANGQWYWNSKKLDSGYVTHWAPMPDGPEFIINTLDK